MQGTQQLIDQIHDAFRETDHPGDAHLVGSQLGCEPEETIGPFKGVRHWTEVDPAILDPHYTALGFFTEGGFRQFLPAFLVADVRGQLQTADPVFDLTHGFAEGKTIEVPAGGRIHRRSNGKSVLVSPRLYGAMTWHDYAVRRLAVFTREEAAAIVAYLLWRRDQDTDGLFQADIDAALESFWRERVRSAPTQAQLRQHIQAEADYMNDLRNDLKKG